jgi:transposase-like protein
MVIKLYSKGVTTREIADLIEKMYGSHYSAIGIKPNGRKEVIDYCIAPNENIEVWTEMLQNMKSRGLKQVELFLSDGVVGMKHALKLILKLTFNAAWYMLCAIFVPKSE